MINLVRQGAFTYVEPEPPKHLDDHLKNTMFLPEEESTLYGLYPYDDAVAWQGSTERLEYEINRMGLSVNIEQHPFDPPAERWKTSIELWSTQTEAVDALYKAQSGVIEASPGSGKTVMITELVCRIARPTLIVVHQGLPLSEFYETLTEYTHGIQIGCQGEKQNTLGDVVVATIQTINNQLGTGSKFDLWVRNTCEVCVIDEGHRGVTDSCIRLIHEMNNLLMLYAATATYRRDDERHSWLQAVYGKPVHRITYRDNIEAGVLVPISVYARRVPAKDYGLMQLAQENDWTKVERAAAYRQVINDYVIKGDTGFNEMVVQDVQRELAKNHTSAIIVNQLDQVDTLKDMIPEAEVIVGGTEDRAAIKRALDNREFGVLISTVFDEAVNVRSLDTVIIAAANKTTVKAEQRVRCGRGCNRLPNGTPWKKERGYVYTYIFQTDWLFAHYPHNKKTLLAMTTQHELNRYYEEQRNGTWKEFRAR